MNLAFMDEMISKVLLEFNEDPCGVRHRLSFFASCLKNCIQELNKLAFLCHVHSNRRLALFLGIAMIYDRSMGLAGWTD